MTTFMGAAMYLAVAFCALKVLAVRSQLNIAKDRWLTAGGEVIDSAISSEHSGTYDNPNRTFRANVRYRYEVDGRPYENDTICIGGQLQLSMRGKAEAYCRRYPEGAAVTVHYDPKKPRTAVLEVREETTLMYAGIGLLFAGVGTALIAGWM